VLSGGTPARYEYYLLLNNRTGEKGLRAFRLERGEWIMVVMPGKLWLVGGGGGSVGFGLGGLYRAGGFMCYRSKWENCLEVAGGRDPGGSCARKFHPESPHSHTPNQIPFPRTTPGRDPRGNRTHKKSPHLVDPIYISLFNPHIPQYAILYHPPLIPESNTKLTPTLKLLNF